MFFFDGGFPITRTASRVVWYITTSLWCQFYLTFMLSELYLQNKIKVFYVFEHVIDCVCLVRLRWHSFSLRVFHLFMLNSTCLQGLSLCYGFMGHCSARHWAVVGYPNCLLRSCHSTACGVSLHLVCCLLGAFMSLNLLSHAGVALFLSYSHVLFISAMSLLFYCRLWHFCVSLSLSYHRWQNKGPLRSHLASIWSSMV